MATELGSAQALQDMDLELDGDFVFTQHIPAHETRAWNNGDGFVPIGDSSNPFTGTLRGQGFRIVGLFINRPEEEFAGLFSVVHGLIEDVGLKDCNVTGSNRTGPLCARLTDGGIARRCWSTGSVESALRVGGLIGQMAQITTGCEAFDCWSLCSVTGDDQVGGFTSALNSSTMRRCYTAGPVSGDTNTGGMVGTKSGTVIDDANFWDTNVSGQSTSEVGTGKTTAEMQDQDTYTNWDFEDVWTIDPNEYPTLLVEQPPGRDPEVDYRLEIRDSSGSLLRFVPEWHSGQIREELNAPRVLEVTITFSDDLQQFMTAGNELWLRDNRGRLIDRFQLHTLDETGPASYEFRIVAHSLLAQLAREFIDSYTTVSDESPDKTVEDVLGDLLAFQSIEPEIELVHVDDDLAEKQVRLDLENLSILHAFRELHREIGGYYTVDENRGLRWRESIGVDVGQQIRVARNMQSLRHRQEFGDLANRIYAFGAGTGQDRLTLDPADTGTGESYVEDSDSIATHGLRVASYTNQRVKTADTLLEHAKAVLDARKEPVVTFDMDAVDLSKIRGIDYSFDEWALGNTLRVIDETLGVDSSARIIRITRDLDNPLRSRLEIKTRRREMADLFVDEMDARTAAQAHDPVEFAVMEGGQIFDFVQDELEDIEVSEQDIQDGLANAAEGNMADIPFIARLFVGDDIDDVNDILNSFATLEFKDDQDFALTTVDPENVLWARLEGGWVQITRPFMARMFDDRGQASEEGEERGDFVMEDWQPEENVDFQRLMVWDSEHNQWRPADSVWRISGNPDFNDQLNDIPNPMPGEFAHVWDEGIIYGRVNDPENGAKWIPVTHLKAENND